MQKLKLYKVYYMGNVNCFNLRVAASPEEALHQCFGHKDSGIDDNNRDRSCKAEEVEIEGYNITIEKK